jgi:drug/metabolite transporter (DMT)-like permease
VSRPLLAVFVAVAALWGVPYALIAVALDHGAEPLLIAWARVAIGAAILLAAAGARGELRGLHPHAGILAVVAVCDIAAPFAALSYGEQHVSSALAGILVGSTPLFVGALAAAFDPAERPDRRGWLGLAIGFAGVVALFGLGVGGAAWAAGLVLLAALGYAVATLLIRARLHDVPTLAVSAAALALASLLLAPGAALSLPTEADGSAWAAIAALGVGCTAVAFALYYLLIAQAGATTAALTTYLAPVFSVAVGALALGEAIGASAVLGLALILVGSRLAR